MTSINLMLTGAQAWASVNGPLTSGMVGIPVTIEYDQAWDGLTKNLMCRCSPWGSDDGEIRTILNIGDTSIVAHEVMQSGMFLYLGIEGFSNDGKLVIPTTWARCGKIEYGANTGDDPTTDPELPIWNQLQIEMEKTKEYVLTPEQATNIQAYAQEATQSAQEAKQSAEEAKQAVESGLYYIPVVSQPTDATLKFEFKPSITGAPIPKPVTVTLPEGGGNATSLTLASPDGSMWAVVVKDDGALYTIKQPKGDSGGNTVEPETVIYTVTNNITNSTNSNAAVSAAEYTAYSATLTASEGYELDSITVTMGGVDITATAYADGVITIPSVTGDIIITVVAEIATIYSEVQWLDTAYCIGDNSVAKYNGWAPGCAHYDPDLGKVVFLQCHRSGHAGVFTDSQLWAIDPYNVMEAELLATFAPVNVGTGIVPLAFAIYGGKYYVQSWYKTYISGDKGKTWTETVPTAPLPRCYGLTIIDDVMYVGDDAMAEGHNGLYYTSEDFGANWTERVFDFADDYAGQLNCSEASFVKFGGKIYAALRREEATGLLAVQDPATGVWSVISEEMPNVASDVYFYATADTLCFCAIDRPARKLHLGTIDIGETGVTINTVKTYNFNGISGHGDFHTPTYVYGPDFQMVTLMCGGLANEYGACNNIAIVGYADLVLNNNPTYSIAKTATSKANITAEPYVGTSPYVDGAFSSIAAGSVINLNIRHCNTHPLDEDGNVYILSPGGGYLYVLGTSNVYGYYLWDGFEHNGKLYACFVKGTNTEAPWSGIKIMGKAHKSVRANVDDLGGVTPEGGVFDYAFWSEFALGNSSTISGYAITAEYVEPVRG